MNDESDLEHEKEARADRLKRARLLAGLSRKDMGEGQSAIHSDTYKGWETARFGGLTDKGAQKVVEKLKAHGMNCSVNWLLYGVGVAPFEDHSIALHSSGSNSSLDSIVHKMDQIFETAAYQMAKELTAFKSQEDSIDFCITDDWMAPWYLPGDLVAGVKLSSSVPLKDGFDCIVQLSSGEVLLRKVYQGKAEGFYNLLTHKSDGPLLTEVKLSFIAPVLWWRRSLKTVLKS